MSAYEIKPSIDLFHSASKKTYNIPSSMLKTVDGATFVNVNPARCRKIGTLLLSRCTKDLQAKNNDPSFWYRKKGEGHKKVLAAIAKMRKSVIKAKYGIVGDRLTTRKMKSRAVQLATDRIELPFPATDTYPSHSVAMYHTASTKKVGTSSIWIEMTPKNVECLLNFTQHALSSDDKDSSEAPAADSSGASENEDNADNANDESDKEAQCAEPSPTPSATSEPVTKPSSTGYRIFDALLGRN